jgi:hypothetical protein
MLHLHFGTGRLGLGLVVPAFQAPAIETVLLNRAVSGANATGSTALGAERRNELLKSSPDRAYRLRMADAASERDETISYAGFYAYHAEDVRSLVREIAKASAAKLRGVVVTGSVLKLENYGAVVEALNALSQMKEAGEPIGPIFLVACENTVSAEAVLNGPELEAVVMPSTRRQVAPVAALVDRMCVGLEEDTSGAHAMVCVRTEPYASLKLELSSTTESLQNLCAASAIEFSRHLDVEKQIKGWLLNGTHWLIALEAFQASQGDRAMKLNEFIAASPEHRRHAIAVMDEMREGVAILLRRDPTYANFVREVDVDDYLAGAATAILQRFFSTEDPITRILARFQAPATGDAGPIDAFSQRFADRINGPIGAYEAEKGIVPPAAGRGLLSLLRLVESGTFIDSGPSGKAYAC